MIKIYYKKDLTEAVKYAYVNSRKKLIIIEEYLVKDHNFIIGGDIVIFNGKIILYGLLNCHRNKKANDLVPIGKSHPIDLNKNKVDIIKNELQRLITKTNIKFGVFNIELIFNKEKLYILDIGARCGGNMIPQLLSIIYNIDVTEFIIKSAMGENIEFKINKEKGCYCSYNIHSEKYGVLKEIKIADEIKSNIIFTEIYKKKGDSIEFFNFSSKLLGIVFLKFNSKNEMLNFYNNTNEYIKVITE